MRGHIRERRVLAIIIVAVQRTELVLLRTVQNPLNVDVKTDAEQVGVMLGLSTNLFHGDARRNLRIAARSAALEIGRDLPETPEAAIELWGSHPGGRVRRGS